MPAYVALVDATRIIESAFRASSTAGRDAHRAATVALAELSLVTATEPLNPVPKLCERLLARADALARWPDHATWAAELRRIADLLRKLADP